MMPLPDMDDRGDEMGTRIALVDDDQNILTSVSLTLESEGFEVDCYHDGETALQGLSRRPAELAVLDIKMPRMDGMELLHNCLLYTSPSPRDRFLSRMPSSA